MWHLADVETFGRSFPLSGQSGRLAAAAEPGVAMARKPPTLREWDISLIGAKSKYIGRVEAADAESAIDKAMEEFRIDKARRFKVVAEPVE